MVCVLLFQGFCGYLRGSPFIVTLTFFVLVALTFVHNTRKVVQGLSLALLTL
jgi:hypothetical protein